MIEWLVNLIMIIVSPKASVDVIIIYLFRTYILLQSVRLSGCLMFGLLGLATTMYKEYEIGERVFLEFLKVLSEYPPQSSNLTSSLSITQI